MTLQLNNSLHGSMPVLVHEGFGIRRNPLTGELVSLAQTRTVEPNSRLRALTANVESLETEQLWGRYSDNVPDPLSYLSNTLGHHPQLPIVSKKYQCLARRLHTMLSFFSVSISIVLSRLFHARMLLS